MRRQQLARAGQFGQGQDGRLHARRGMAKSGYCKRCAMPVFEKAGRDSGRVFIYTV
jgi:hypothetical protein